jgi:hypothetical protein
MNEIVKQFKDLGFKASYHFADDSGKEWHLGNDLQKQAMDLFFANPDDQAEMLEISKEFLWSMRMELRYRGYEIKS